MKLYNIITGKILPLSIACMGLLGACKSEKVGLEPADIAPLANPDRGYHIECRFWASDLKNRFSRGGTYPDAFIDQGLKELNATDDGVTLVQQYIYLTEYVETPVLPEQALQNIRTIMQGVQDHGYKMILRFAYNWTGLGTEENETQEIITGHIAQLKPVIREYLGNIATIQMGFMGAWGEWHNSPLWHNQNAKNAIVDATLDMYPAPYCIEMRLPEYKNDLAKGTPAIGEEKLARIGFNNDYFTAGTHPKAPGNDYVPGDENYRESVKVAPYCFMSGEIPYNENSEWGLATLIDRNITLTCLRDNHYSALDISQNNELNIASWKEYYVTAGEMKKLGILFDEGYFKENGKEVSRRYYDFVRDHLGYRLNVKEVMLNAESGKLDYQVDLTNTGFATVVNPKEVYLVLISGDNAVTKEIKVEVNPKDWQPYDVKKNDYVALKHSLKGNADVSGLSGKYKVGIWMPETSGNLKYNNKFAVKFAASGWVTPWTDADGKYAVNVIGEVNL